MVTRRIPDKIFQTSAERILSEVESKYQNDRLLTSHFYQSCVTLDDDHFVFVLCKVTVRLLCQPSEVLFHRKTSVPSTNALLATGCQPRRPKTRGPRNATAGRGVARSHVLFVPKPIESALGSAQLEDRPEKTHRGGPTTDEAASRGCFDVFVGASKPRPRASFRHGQRPRCSDSRCVSDDRISEPPFVLFTCSLCSKRETQERRGSSARARPPVVHSPVVLDSVRGETTKDCRKAKIN